MLKNKKLKETTASRKPLFHRSLKITKQRQLKKINTPVPFCRGIFIDPDVMICYALRYKFINFKEILIARTTRLNGEIKAPELRVIDDDGKQLGILSRSEALAAAENRGLDLVEISADNNPPIVKITDWGKYNYKKTKQLQKNKKASKASELKQIRFGLKIGEHDLQIKLSKASDFLDEGHKVRFTIMYRGREQAHKELGFKLAEKVIEQLGDRIVIDQQPTLAGRQLNFVVRSNTNAKVKNS